MKAAAVAAGLLLMILSVSFFEMWYVNKSLDSLIADVEQVEKAYRQDDEEGMKSNLEKLDQNWAKEQKKLCSVVTMRELNNIEIAIEKMKIYGAHRAEVLFEAEVAYLKEVMHQMRDAEMATLFNFF